jgi:hypothetical protein
MVKIDESRMAERPEGVSEAQWRAKVVYEAVQHEQAKDPETHAARTDSEAKDAADEVLADEEHPPGRRRSSRRE